MWSIRCQIGSPVPEDGNELVDAEITDAHGKRWQFRGKLAIFRGDGGADGIRCVVRRLGRVEQRVAYWVSTAEPDDVSPVDDERTDFVVFDVEFSADPNTYRTELSRIPRRTGIIDIDVLQHEIALALSLFPPGTEFSDAKPHYWSSGGLGDFTEAVIAGLSAEGALMAEPDDETLFRWRDVDR